MTTLSTAQAEAVIQGIRSSRHAEDPGGLNEDANAGDLMRALEMLADTLHHTPTQFILELVQNADDNDYPLGADPRLTLAYHDDGFLWIGCNEVGFNERNVRAICKIAASTKRTEAQRRGYIGEKGIGFKAVFKVASEVWISSGPFEFKFKKEDPLGMIIPILEPFNAHSAVHGTTMFCLRIPKLEDRKEVKNELLKIDRSLLLFLRKLRRIDVKLLSVSGGISTRDFSISREDSTVGLFREVKLVKRSLHGSSSDVARYLVFQGTAANMPHDIKREGVAESELLLAFPVNDVISGPPPSLSKQMLHSFLPVRAYGFTFLLHADFLLDASRHEIISRNLWNNTLVEAAVEVFVKSVKAFNSSDNLAYTWPRYLSSSSFDNAHGTIMDRFLYNVVDRLRQEPVLYSQAGSLQSPAALTIVPPEFSDGGDARHPLLEPPHAYSLYVSDTYHQSHLSVLGVRIQTNKDFLRSLRMMLRTRRVEFDAKPSWWHSRLADAIMRIGSNRVRDLSILPLRNGAWTSADVGLIYFHDVANSNPVPDGIEIRVLEPAATTDSSRRRLFIELGARFRTSEEVCKLIIEYHRSTWTTHTTFDVATWISHLWYLFRHLGNSSTSLSDIIIYTQQGSAQRPNDVYMDVEGSRFSISRLVPAERRICYVLHKDYLSFGPQDQRQAWIQWLCHRVGIVTVPALTRGSSGRLSPEFEYITSHHQSKVWLELLKEHWPHYSSVLLERNSRSIRNSFNSFLVDCTNGSRVRLDATYLATEAITREPLAAMKLPLLDVPTPAEQSWIGPLSFFGCGTTRDLRMYLELLGSVAGSELSTLPVNDLLRLYRCVEYRFEEDPRSARAQFNDVALVRISSQWHTLHRLRWTAPSCLHRVIALRDHYPTLKNLFVTQLGVTGATAVDVTDELVDIGGLSTQSEPDWDRAKELLLELCRCKVRKGDSRCLSPASAKTFFIADRERHRRCFEGKLWFLDFTQMEMKKLQPLVASLNLAARSVATHVKEETIATGTPTFQQDTTLQLQSKSRYISLLANATEQESIFQQLSGVQVWASPNMTLKRSVVVGFDMAEDQTVYGEDEVGRVVISEIEGPLKIYVAEDNVRRGDLPWPIICERLADFLNIDKAKETLLLSVLTTSDISLIDDIFERNNLQPDVSQSAEQEATPLEVSTDDTDNTDADEDSTHSGEDAPVFGVTPDGGAHGPRSAPSLSNPPNSSSRTARVRRGAHDRASAGSPEPRRADINLDSIRRAAEHLQINEVTAVSASTVQSDVNGASELLNPDGAVFGGSSLHTASPGRRNLSGSFVTDQTPSESRMFDMSGMQSALSDAESRSPSYRVREPASTVEQDIGYRGEAFIFEILKRNFQAGDDCWTSRMRSRYGLPPFTGSEGACSDFTVSDPNVSRRVTEWLVETEQGTAYASLDHDVVYHLEVKTTLGVCSEPFMMSNNQVGLARQWHASRSDLYVIFRVYNLLHSPSFSAYLDPIALVLAGQLSFAAKDGYVVQAN